MSGLPSRRYRTMQIACTLGLGALMTWTSMAPGANAFSLLPSRNAKTSKTVSQSVTPPAVDMLDNQCDPIRRQVVALNSQNPVSRFMSGPAKAVLKSRYYKCIRTFNAQERRYLESIAMPTASEGVTALKPVSMHLELPKSAVDEAIKAKKHKKN
jgi:hypothetical protein